MSAPHLHRLGLVASALIAVLIAVLTLMPAEGLPPAPGNDKLHHFTAFAALVLPVVATRPRAVLWIVPAAVLFGGAIELIQPHVGRHGEWADQLANTLGALTGAALGRAAHALLPRAWQRA